MEMMSEEDRMQVERIGKARVLLHGTGEAARRGN